MINLTKKDISKFQDIYKENFGFHIEENEAREKAERLISLVSLTFPRARPPNKSDT